MNFVWLFLVTLFLWVSFGLYVDSQQGPVKRAVIQRVASLLLIIASVSILIFGA